MKAPLHVTSSNKLGPANLGNYYLVIPPETMFYVEGASGAKMRLVGTLGKLDVGEAMPADILARFGNQHNAYVTHLSGSVSLGTDVALAADAETEVFSLTPKTIEKYIFNDLKSEIEKLCGQVEKCMNESARARNRDLKWMVGLMISFVIGVIGWVVVLLKTIL